MIRNILIRVAGYPFYQYRSTRWAFKKFFQIIAVLTSRDLVGTQARFTPREAEILGQLKERGFFLAKPEDFPVNVQEAQKRAMKSALRLIENGMEKLKGTKEYLLNLDLTKAPAHEVESLYEFFSLSEIEALASAYLGEKALMVELKILISPVLEVLDKDGSQLWHSDYDDLSNLKLFIFLDDVTEDAGPLQVLEKSLSSLLMKNWKYRWGMQGLSHNDAIVPIENLSQTISMVGEAGTIAFVDAVQCLHRGSRNPKRARKILYATFNTRTSFRFPPFHWIFGEQVAGSRASPLLKLDPKKKYLTDLAINR
jgi:hypothetical protein